MNTSPLTKPVEFDKNEVEFDKSKYLLRNLPGVCDGGLQLMKVP